ncbi:MAG: hypothetical protein K0R29_2504 [Pseudobdellovibrio sp.]|jgi:hypothetical protein|nr:hypothetical protein [Pseudobdellovibrio sp.]
MKRFLILCLFLQGCGEREVKKMIIEPDPPLQQTVALKECHLHFDKNAELAKIAGQASQISEECAFSQSEFEAFSEAELN